MKKIINKLINGVSSDDQLIELSELMRVHLDGIALHYEVEDKPPKSGTYLLLLKPKQMPIGHWVAIHNYEYFDPVGIGPPSNLGKMKYNHFQYQSAYGEYCGIWCMLWLYSKQKNKPHLMEGFNDLDMDVIDN
jgi:hypothetical protein